MADDDTSSTHPEEVPGTRPKTESRAGEAARVELGRVASADAAAGVPEYDVGTHFEHQRRALERLRASDPSFAFQPDSVKYIAEGAEHIVEHLGHGQRVLKHSKGFGFIVDADYALEGTGGWKTVAELRTATPLEYLARIGSQNRVFGSDLRVEGITRNNSGEIGFAVSQRTISGGEPPSLEIEKYLRSFGFRRVRTAAFANRYISNKTWFDPETGWMVTDVKPDNFKKTPVGDIVVIDVIAQHFPSDHDLHKLFSQFCD